MPLVDWEIRRDIEESHRIGVEPYDPSMIQPASLDVRLDKHFKVLTHRGPIHPAAAPVDFEDYTVPREGAFILQPGDFVLGSTYEKITLPSDRSAQFEGKSSLGRLGLLTHITAGFIDPGFSGHITLELSNVTQNAIYLLPGMKIGQLCFEWVRMAERPYGSAGVGSHYQGQSGPQTSRSYVNFHQTDVWEGDAP